VDDFKKMIDGVIDITRRGLIFSLQSHPALAGEVESDKGEEFLHVHCLPVSAFDRVCGLWHVDFE
jgi:hypothetical protein